MSAAKGLDRRRFVQSAAWSLPVIAASVAVPLAAASPALQDRLKFNTASTWDENSWDEIGNYPRIGVVVGVMDATGPDPVGPVSIVVSIYHADGSETRTIAAQIPGGWGATDDFTVYFEGVVSGEYEVDLYAEADGCAPITRTLKGRTVS